MLSADKAYKQSQRELTEVKKQLAELQLDLNAAQQVQTVAPKETAETETTEEQAPTAASMTLSIEVGMTSSEISEKLAATTTVLHTDELDNYLSDQGLAGRVQVGNYELNSSMSLKQIAETITR